MSSGLYAQTSSFKTHSQRHCGYCHQPHRNFDPNDTEGDFGVPLFSTAQTKDGMLNYQVYTSHWFDKYEVPAGQPNGATKLCLGCHDGSYVSSHAMTHVFGVTDLKKSHPVSINYEAYRKGGAPGGAALKDSLTGNLTPLGHTIAVDLLDEQGNVQCTSCHDVHLTGFGTTMLKWDSGTEWLSLCTACHAK
jgi:cytochrome c peroxidase